MTGAGVEQAWAILARFEPTEVCARAAVTFEKAAGHYVLASLGQELLVSPSARTIVSRSADGERLATRFKYFSTLAILWYLVRARSVPPSGQWIRPTDTPAGTIYFRGSHVLPLDKIAARYGSDKSAFLRQGLALAGEPLTFGDASLRLLPFSRIPVALILWEADDEFPARADLLFDSTCELHMPVDILWSTAMLSVLMMQ